jgi:hypothetical protein
MATKQRTSLKPVDVKIERAVRVLKCQLTPEEVRERADLAARFVEQRDQKEAEAKTASSHLKSQIKQIDADLRKVSAEVRDRATFRDVELEIHFDYRRAIVVTHRTDTGEVIGERPMLEHERQKELFEGDGKPADAKPEKPPAKKQRKPRAKKTPDLEASP